jgi:hypothetical protein
MFESTNPVLKSCFPEGDTKTWKGAQKRPKTAGRLFIDSMDAMIELLNTKVRRVHSVDFVLSRAPTQRVAHSSFTCQTDSLPPSSTPCPRLCPTPHLSHPPSPSSSPLTNSSFSHHPSTQVPSYVRCIKPNQTRSSHKIEDELMQHQVQYLGLVENVRVRRAGYCFRETYKDFLWRYRILSKTTYVGVHTHTHTHTHAHTHKLTLATPSHCYGHSQVPLVAGFGQGRVH